MIHLDTNFLIRGLARGTPQDKMLRDWLKRGETLGMSTVAWTELLCGPIDTRHLQLATAIVSERVPLVEDDSALAARLFNESGRRRGTLADCMIAATALRSKAPLATANPADFNRFEDAGLTVLTA